MQRSKQLKAVREGERGVEPRNVAVTTNAKGVLMADVKHTKKEAKEMYMGLF